jgi:hypothetical protein
MERADVIRLLGAPTKTFRRTASASPTDVFDGAWMQVSYDSDDRVEFVETYGSVDVWCDGVRLSGRGRADLDVELRLRFPAGAVVSDRDGIELPYAGVSIYAPGERVEAVAAYARGYR